MANVLVQESSLQDIADAIRSKNGTQNTYKPAQMADAIEAISGGGITPTGTISITANGTVDVTSYASANVNVPTGGSEPSLGTKSITANGTYTASDDSLDGYSQVTVNVPIGTTPTGTKQISITQNGTTTEDVTNYADAEITVNVSGSSSLPKTGTVTPSERVTSISFDVGTTETIKHVIVLPASETPLKSNGKTVIGVIANAESSFFKYIGVTSNNSGAGWLAPVNDTSSTYFTQSGSIITVSPYNAGSFETITYTWVAW